MTTGARAPATGIATCIITMFLVTEIFHPASDLVAPAIGGPLGFAVSSAYLAIARRRTR